MNDIEVKKQKIENYSYVLGLLSFILLGKLIGNKGITYMAVIIECISLFVILSSAGAADAIGKMIRARRKKNQYKEASKLHKSSFLIQLIMAFLGMLIYFFVTDVFAEVIFKLPFLSVAMKLLTPVILLRVLQSNILGYFQGIGTHMPTVGSCIFRQLFFLLFGLLFTGKLSAYGQKVSLLLNNPDYEGMYGAFGLCIAVLISEILISLFLLIVYIGSDRNREKQKEEEGLQKMESFSERVRLFFFLFGTETLKNILKKLPFFVLVFFVLYKETPSETAESFGPIYGIFICICAILVLCIKTRIIYIIHQLNNAVKKKDKRKSREIIYAGMHYCWIAGLYVAVSMAVLSPQLSIVSGNIYGEVLQKCYTQGAAVLAVLIMNIFIGKALHTLGARRIIYILLLGMNILFTVCFVIFRRRDMDMVSEICLSAFIACTIMLIASFVVIVRKYVLQPDLIAGALIPVVGAGTMGLVAMLIQKLLAPHVSSLICLLLCLAFGFIVYLLVLNITGSVKKAELDYVYGPMGRKLFGMFFR